MKANPEESMPLQIESIAEEFAKLFRQRKESRAEEIFAFADVIQTHHEEWATDLRGQLKQQLSHYDATGFPPSFVYVAGQSDLEKPFNRLLAWLADPEESHGLGSGFLSRLAKHVELPEMEKDLSDGEILIIQAEQTLEGDDSGKMPDLVVRTDRAALLLENKVWSPESGGDQYKSYLDIFERWAWAHGVPHKRAILCSREQQNVPERWDKAIRHSDLAIILYDIARSEENSTMWGKITAIMCAVAFENETPAQKVQEARNLLHETSCPPVTLDQVIRLRKVLPLPQPQIQWRITNDE